MRTTAVRCRNRRTIELAFGSLLQRYTRGHGSAHKTMLFIAIAFNLEKLLKHQSKQVVRLAIALTNSSAEQRILPSWRKYYRR
jgi:hypothetical protein